MAGCKATEALYAFYILNFIVLYCIVVVQIFSHQEFYTGTTSQTETDGCVDLFAKEPVANHINFNKWQNDSQQLQLLLKITAWFLLTQYTHYHK